MPKIESLKVKIFADGADRGGMMEMLKDPMIKGFTTNPTLMRRAGIRSYEDFARDILAAIRDHPISFEVFADDHKEMRRQAKVIASWGRNVYVKIPVTNTAGVPSEELVRELAAEGIKQNVTALMTVAQVEHVAAALEGGASSFISVFAGRIADTGRDPVPLMIKALSALTDHPQIELIWASPRELLNVFQANEIGCHIITATNDILSKLKIVGRDLAQYSLETVRMFHADAEAANLKL